MEVCNLPIDDSEYRPIMLRGWTHLPHHLWPDYLPVDHLPWVFRDVVNYAERKTLNRSCVFIKQVGDELNIKIEHLGIHWLVERKIPETKKIYPFHHLQTIECTRYGRGPRFIASRCNGSEFNIPNVIIDFHNGVPNPPIIEHGGCRMRVAKERGIPYVVTVVKEQHYQDMQWLEEKERTYIVPMDPRTVVLDQRGYSSRYDRMVESYEDGKRWDKIVERGYIRSGEFCCPFTVFINEIPRFFRETDYLQKSENEGYEIIWGQYLIDKAKDEGLDVVIALFTDILRVDSETLTHHNRLHDLTSRRKFGAHNERRMLRIKRSKSRETE